MKLLSKVLQNCVPYTSLLNDINGGYLPVSASGLSNVHKALISTALVRDTGKKIIVITPDEASAVSLMNDALSMGIKATDFPVRDLCLTDMSGRSREYEHKRIDTLSKLLDGAFQMLVTSVEAAIQYTIPPEVLREKIFAIRVAEEYPIEKLVENLLGMGYVRTDIVEGVGQFSVRGGILDLFAANTQNPVRIEYWGDEIDTLSYFDVETQRRTEVVDEIKLSPAAEVVFNSYSLADSLENYLKTTKKLSEKRKARLESDIQLLKGEVDIVADRYLSAVYRNATIFDYVDDAVILVSDSAGVFDTLGGVFARSKEDAQLLCDDGFISAGFDKFTLDQTEFEEIINKAVFL